MWPTAKAGACALFTRPGPPRHPGSPARPVAPPTPPAAAPEWRLDRGALAQREAAAALPTRRVPGGGLVVVVEEEAMEALRAFWGYLAAAGPALARVAVGLLAAVLLEAARQA